MSAALFWSFQVVQDMPRTTALAGPQYRLVSFGSQKSGASGGYEATISGVVKRNVTNAPYCIPNEYICATVGRFLGLPIPPAGILFARQDANSPVSNDSTPYWFASLDFNIQGDTLPSVGGAKCVADLPDLSGGLLLFDILVANGDRHGNNIAVDHLAQPPKMSIFDHSHALFGSEATKGTQHLADVRDSLALAGHCLLGHVTTDQHFHKWKERIEAIPNFFLEDTVRFVVGVGIDEAEADAAMEFLRYRRDHLAALISANKNAFTGIKQWSLL